MCTRLRLAVAALAIAVLIYGSVTAQTPQTATQPRVDALFNRFTSSTPGCAVGADVRGESVIRAAYGSADLEHAVPIATDTIFEAGSVSKQFTAAAVVLLARAGKLSLDDPVRKYVPELPDFGAPLTTRRLVLRRSDPGCQTSMASYAWSKPPYPDSACSLAFLPFTRSFSVCAAPPAHGHPSSRRSR